MTTFNEFRNAVNQRLETLGRDHLLFRSKTTGDELWETYLASFPEGTNPIFRERTEHDCSCCRQFIKGLGQVLAVVDNKLVSIWDVDITGTYAIVAKALSEIAIAGGIENVYLSKERSYGVMENTEHTENGDIVWNHFYGQVPESAYSPVKRDRELGVHRDNKTVLERSIREISDEAIQSVLDLINDNLIYRGEEHKVTVQKLKQTKKGYDKASNKEIFLWLKAAELRQAGRFRNTVIGTLLTDISDGVELEKAVKSFEQKVAPENYKRSKSLITPAMIKKAESAVKELGLESALHRRFAVMTDLTVNNVLFADRQAKKVMEGSVFDQLVKETKSTKKVGDAQEINVTHFIENILPESQEIEIFIQNKHQNNFMSLIAPMDESAGNLMKWDNNFSWSYNGEVTDSIKERVKTAGGKVDAVVRASLAWPNKDDLDLHVYEPNGGHIYFSSKKNVSTSGELDVDMNAGHGTRGSVENITWQDRELMSVGGYRVVVNNYCKREKTLEGFEVELDLDGTVYNFAYDQAVSNGQNVEVAKFHYDGHSFELKESLPHSATPVDLWNLQTESWRRVDLVLNSPNHWDDQTEGNLHLFFIINECKNPDSARGFYNEFLKGELVEHRKVFEVLSSKMKAEPTDDQLSGLGFSSTRKDEVLVRVKNEHEKVYKICF